MARKWNGKSTYQLDQKLTQRSNLAFSLRNVRLAVEAQIATAEGEAKEEIIRLLGRKDLDWQDLVLGGHECPGSPTLFCLYDHAEDPHHDRCLVCEEPSDRG